MPLRAVRCQNRWRRLIQDVSHLRFAQASSQGNEDRSELRGHPIEFRETMAVIAEHRDPIIRADSETVETSCCSGDTVAKLLVGPALFPTPERDVLRIHLHRSLECVKKVVRIVHVDPFPP